MNIKKTILDILFPISCVRCGKDGDWICRECFSSIHINEKQLCPICENIESRQGELCHKCFGTGKDAGFKSLILAAEYKQISKLVHLLKYNFAEDISGILGEILVSAFVASGLALPDAIIPVPIHKSKMRLRGFNQSELLADFLAARIAPGMDIPVIKNVIKKIRRTPPQMKVGNYKERFENIKGSFSLYSKFSGSIEGKQILLIDDIVTTGATISECARTLQLAKPKEIRVLALARQKMI